MKFKKAIYIFFVTLIFCAMAFQVSEAREQRGSTYQFIAGDSVYESFEIKKNDNFKDLIDWLENNISSDKNAAIFYLPETVRNVIMDNGKFAISYETWQYDHFVLNTLVDANDKLLLYTIKDTEFNPVSDIVDYDNLYKDFNYSFYKTATSCDSKYSCNCVLWLRYCRAQWLPTRMTYIWEKRARINTSEAKSGRIAVMDIYYPYGHVGYVTKVSGSKITLEEANYISCKVTSRTGTKSSMKIVGYIKK